MTDKQLQTIPLPPGLVSLKSSLSRRESLSASAVPSLHSRPDAPFRLLIDLNGRTEPSWRPGSFTPPFGGDSAVVTAIHYRVARAYGPFNVDVTTDDNPNDLRPTAIIAVGGSSNDWYGGGAGGASVTGGFRWPLIFHNVGFVFTDDIGSNAKLIADRINHESGHIFGLYHQALWVNGVMEAEYRTDGPIMGEPYAVAEPFWTVGRTSDNFIQDDVAVLTTTLGLAPPPLENPMTDAEKASILSAVASLRSAADALAALTGTTPTNVTRITAPNGTITSPDGTVFSFGGAQAGGYAILVNGSHNPPTAAAAELGIKSGVVYAHNDRGNWFQWTGTTWQGLSYDPFA